MQFRNALIAAAGLALVAGATSATAQPGPDNRWQANHPAREEVNQRLQNINGDVRGERRDGEVSRREAMRFHHRAHFIRMEERRMAWRHGGHLTRHEVARLNHQENRLRNRVGE